MLRIWRSDLDPWYLFWCYISLLCLLPSGCYLTFFLLPLYFWSKIKNFLILITRIFITWNEDLMMPKSKINRNLFLTKMNRNFVKKLIFAFQTLSLTLVLLLLLLLLHIQAKKMKLILIFLTFLEEIFVWHFDTWWENLIEFVINLLHFIFFNIQLWNIF